MLLFVIYEVFLAFPDSCRAVKCTFMLCELLSGCPSEVVVPLSVGRIHLDVPAFVFYR